MNNKFNLIFCVVVCVKKPKYEERLKHFINLYGYKWKNKNLNIKIVFLAEDEPKPSFVGEEYVWHNSPNLSMGLRFINYIKDLKLETDWIMQVDDDSSTDLDKTVELLDQFYDPKDSMILMGGRNTDLEMGVQYVLRQIGLKNFFFASEDVSKFNHVPYFIHAWEPSIFSKKAIEKIKEWKDFEKFKELCALAKPVFTDQTPYAISKLIKIPAVECLFLSPFFSFDEYSGVNKNGRFSHIHYVVEQDSNYSKLINLLKLENYQNSEEAKNVYEFWAYDKIPQKERFIAILSLKKDGTIGIYSNPNEKFWENKDGKIYLYDLNKSPSSILWETKSGSRYEGAFLKDSNIIHKLIKIK